MTIFKKLFNTIFNKSKSVSSIDEEIDEDLAVYNKIVTTGIITLPITTSTFAASLFCEWCGNPRCTYRAKVREFQQLLFCGPVDNYLKYQIYIDKANHLLQIYQNDVFILECKNIYNTISEVKNYFNEYQENWQSIVGIHDLVVNAAQVGSETLLKHGIIFTS